MNYRHHFHAGNFADVMKHALLVRLLRALQRKPRGYLFLDTHAGRGAYALEPAGAARSRAPEWPDGIGRLWERPGLSPALRDYLDLVREFDRRAAPATRASAVSGPRRYPGSPWLARLAARPQDRLAAWERHAVDGAFLARSLAGERRTSVARGDGYGALRAALPPPERRALVLIDPPFEDGGEWARIGQALREGLGRLPSAVCAVWYPLTPRSGGGGVPRGIVPRPAPEALAAELEVDPDAAGLGGCGLLVLNPPWRFEAEARAVLDELRPLLARSPRARSAVRRW